MYLEHWGLREAPFRLTPLTDFFFTGARRGDTAEALAYAVLHDEGIVEVSGEVGAGKTMLCRVLIERLPDTVDTLYLANPTLEPLDLLRAIARELGLGAREGGPGELLEAIQASLIERHGAGRRVVALIDEAHAMPRASLEQVRLLSNLETGRHKLLQVVLFGQPELDALLEARDMRPLRDRITQHFRLAPLNAEEVAAYLDFRMRTAGYRGPAVFSPAASRRIARIAAGLTRRINVLADKSLLAAFTLNLHAVNPAHVASAARDADYLPRRTRHPGTLAVPALLAGAAIVAIVAWLRIAQAPDSPAPTVPPAPAAEASEADAAPPPAPAMAPPSSPAEDAPAEASPTSAAPDTTHPFGPRARAALAAQAQWMAAAADETWFIQLHTNTDAAPATLEAQLAAAQAALPDEPLRIYATVLGEHQRTGVVIGRFASQAGALRALAELPARYRDAGAYVRQAEHLR